MINDVFESKNVLCHHGIKGMKGYNAMNNEIRHYGVLGMKWGVRKYQNADGTLTAAGKKRYGEDGEHKYTSLETRILNKGASRGGPNAERNKRMAERSQDLDNRMLQYANRVKTGGNIAVRILTAGRVGGRSYQTILSAMGGQNEAGFTGKKLAAALLSPLPYSAIVARMAYSSGATDKLSNAYNNLTK